jgi:hypothetical protein
MIDRYKEMPFIRPGPITQRRQSMLLWQVKGAHFADLEPSDAEHQPRCDSCPIQFQPILLSFHSARKHEDQVGWFCRIVA